MQKALESKMQATTVFMIAEKISSVIKADTILVLDNGELVGIGTHSELLKSSPIYQEIYAAQLSRIGGQA